MGNVIVFPQGRALQERGLQNPSADMARINRLCSMASGMRQAMLEAVYFSESESLRRRLRGALLVLDMLQDEELQDARQLFSDMQEVAPC
jgi:hypothetical protein